MNSLCLNLQICLLTLLFYVEEIHTVPFLYNNNETPIEVRPISNIANLRRAKVEELSKYPEYEVDHYPDNSQNDTMHNEASPGFFQKQLEKVYSKLQFLTKFNENNDNFEKVDNQTLSNSSQDNGSNNSTNIEVLLHDNKHPEEPTDFRIFSYVSSSSSESKS